MGALLGLLAGVGAVLVLWALTDDQRSSALAGGATRPEAPRGIAQLVISAGHPELSATRVMGTCVALGSAGALLALIVSASPAVALVLGGASAWAPIAVLRRRRDQRQRQLRAAWPEVIDDLVSAVRAGMSLPEGVAELAQRGPLPLRPAFEHFASDYRVTGRFEQSLDRLKDELADPVADRVVEGLRLAREVGGTDLGRLLRTLSSFLREESRIRAEVETRQGWTVNAARLAVAAPWVTLVLLSLRHEAVRAYSSPTGFVVLLVCAGVTFAAYRLMLRIGRLPQEPRVLG
jgi:tight adherence protein B